MKQKIRYYFRQRSIWVHELMSEISRQFKISYFIPSHSITCMQALLTKIFKKLPSALAILSENWNKDASILVNICLKYNNAPNHFIYNP